MSRWSRRQALQALGAVALGSLAGCSVVDEQIRRHTRWSADRVAWAGPMNDSPRSLVLTETSLYSGTHWGVYAFDPAGGDQQWYTELDSPDDTLDYTGDVTTNDDLVYTSGSGEIIALDPSDGTREWTQGVEGYGHRLQATADRLYACEKSVRALDAHSGEEVWTTDLAAEGSRPTVVDGTVYVGTRDGVVVALDATDGEERWRRSLGGARVRQPAVVDSTVYVGGLRASSGTVVALEAETGEVVWQESTTRVGPDQAPALTDDAVFVGGRGDGQAQLVAHDRSDGSRQWTTDAGTGLVGPPTATADTVYAGATDGMFYAVDRSSGAIQWQFDAGSPVDDVAPIVGDGALYVAGEGHVGALETGRRPQP